MDATTPSATDSTLRDALAALDQECLRASRESEARLRALEADRERGEAELQGLTRRLTEIDKAIEKLIETRRGEGAERAEREYKIVYEALSRSFDAVVRARADWKALAKLNAQHRALLRGDAGLLQAVHDYKDFEKNRPALAALPEVHRQALLDAQAALHKRVAPYLAIQESASGLWKDRPLVLQAAVARDADRDRIYWIVALPENLLNLPAGLSDDLSDLVVMVVNGMKDIGGQPGWAFKQVLMRSWAGFTEVMAVDARDGEGDLARLTQQLIQARLDDTPLRVGEAVKAQVAEISHAAWRIGRERPDAAQTGSGPALAEARTGDRDKWYTDEDVRYWNRPFTATLNVLWNAQARRLRTLLMRLIERGMVGDSATPLEPLWRSLPQPDAREMLAGIERLVAKGLLVEQADGPDRRVSLNPDLIGEAHNLIEREMSEFWSDVFGASARAEA